jgi:hypothetical protein
VFTARYALSPYIKQTRFVFKGLMSLQESVQWPAYGLGDPRFATRQGKETFFPTNRLHRLLDPPSLLFSGYWRLDSRWQSGRSVRLNTPSNSAEGKNEWNYTSIYPVWVHGLRRCSCILLILFSFWIQFSFVTVVPKYLNCATFWGTRWRSWLRHCATNRNVAVFDSRLCHWNFSLA